MIDEVNTTRHESSDLASGGLVKAISSRGKLAYLLSNQTYIGCVRHKDQIFDGEHEGIVNRSLFDEVQRLLKTQAPARRSSSNVAERHLLTGLVYDETGQKLRSVHTNKQGSRYRYYVSQALAGRRNNADGWRLPARPMEHIVTRKLIAVLQNHPQLTDWLRLLAPEANLAGALDQTTIIVDQIKDKRDPKSRGLVRNFVSRISLKPAMLTITIDQTAVVQALLTDSSISERSYKTAQITLECPLNLRRRGVEMRMVVTDAAHYREPDPGLVRLILKAHRYLDMLTDGENQTIIGVAARQKVAPADISRILPLAFLSPSLTDDILAGTQPVGLTSQYLSWQQQLELLAPR